MYTNTYLPDVQTAREELKRLRAIDLNLCEQIIALKDDKSYEASAWSSIYADRLRNNVRPAIKECQDFIKRAA